ncbi:hypothetical protein ACFOYW_12510 [Gryllotalpicola reticulitermitis]|uniref:PilZ domain-containing protein n=1 Tax=Gryllotalpicola reticulitermitis TaxID=1184153 RepID=A0ABV8Q9T4_9MICO
MADELDRGALVATMRPWSVGINAAGYPVSAGFPGARRFQIYEGGLLVQALSVVQFIERAEILAILRVPLGVRVHWELGAGEGIAFVSSPARGRMIRALESAGYTVA